MRGWFRRVFKGGSGPGDGGGDAPRPDPNDRWWHQDFPDWALAMKTPERFTLFMDAVERYFVRRKLTARISPEGYLELPENSPLPGRFGLTNLLQSCAMQEQDEWNGQVAAHFDTLARSHAQRGKFDAQIKDWAFSGPRLRVRLWDAEDLPPLRGAVLAQDIPGLVSALVVDLPEEIRSVSVEERAGWGLSDREVFRLARDNVLKEVQPEAKPLDPDRPNGLLIVEADSFYTASAALDAEMVPGLIGQHGVFLSMPVRHGLLAWRFDEFDDIQGVGPLVRATRRLFDDGPGSLSSRVWWLRGGSCYEVGYESSPEHVAVIPPPELIEYLRHLAEDQDP